MKFSALISKHGHDSVVHYTGVELINQGQDHPTDLLSTENNQEGQWGGGSWQEKERTGLNILHFNRVRNSQLGDPALMRQAVLGCPRQDTSHVEQEQELPAGAHRPYVEAKPKAGPTQRIRRLPLLSSVRCT